nr:uncharacterized protein LOC113395266 [Vanessa tameamea]
MYVAVIEPIILYAASVWAPAAEKISTQKHLNSVQRGFAQKICKSYRTVSLNAALILSGLLPLDLRIKEAATLYEAKRGKPQELLRGREVEGRASYLETPHPAEEQRITFSHFGDNKTGDADGEELMIFTDGSKIEGRVGAALTSWCGGKEVAARKFVLAPYCSVYQAELHALYQATNLAAKQRKKSVRIISDSRSALQTLEDQTTTNKIAVVIKRNVKDLAESGITTSFFLVKAHVGVWGNERADELAKEAALRTKKAANYDRCPLSYIKWHIRQETIKEWDKRYINSEKAEVTKTYLTSRR